MPYEPQNADGVGTPESRARSAQQNARADEGRQAIIRAEEALRRRWEAGEFGPGTALFRDQDGRLSVKTTDADANARWKRTQAGAAPPAAPERPTLPQAAPPTFPDLNPQPAAPRPTAAQRLASAPDSVARSTSDGFNTGAISAQPRRAVSNAPAGGEFFDTMAPDVQGGSGAPANPWAPASQDTSRYDARARELAGLQQVFLDQLRSLTQPDPFGNQAALQQATDRSVAQAAGTAAAARGGPAALAGAGQAVLGQQAAMSARGAQDVIAQRRQDEMQARGLGLEAIRGASDIGQQLTANEIALGDQAIRAAETNLKGFLAGQELGQRERENLRAFALEVGRIDQARYATDMAYRQSVDADLTQRYIAGTQLEAAYAGIRANQEISPKDWLQGAVGLATGVAGAIGTGYSSDRTVKNVERKRPAKALREYLEQDDGAAFYTYKEPTKPGRRAGRNFGGMAQNLAKSEIGRTLVSKSADGTLQVDAGRLALADHSALVSLSKRLAKLERNRGRR